MQTISRRSHCHEQKQQSQTSAERFNTKANSIRTALGYLKSRIWSVVKPRPDYSHSLGHLNEHQLRDIGFTRESADRKLPNVNAEFLQCGLHEQRRIQIRRLPKS